MFVRVKSTPKSPRKSVQIVESYRIGGKVRQKIVKHIGVAKDDKELEELKSLANSIKIKLELDGQLPLYTPKEIEEREKQLKEKKEKESIAQNNKINLINQLNKKEEKAKFNVNLLDIEEEDRIIKGIHDIYGKLYDELGFDRVIGNKARNARSIKILKEMVLARVANPDSKRGSVFNLQKNFGVELELKAVYKMMDKLGDYEIKRLNKLVYEETKKLFKEKIDLIFFDATTLYFESFTEDEFKKNGYSKDGKFNQPQVVLALMVTKNGLPVGYKAFKGDTFDGHTLIPLLKEVKENYDLDKVVFVADSGMFSKENLKEFEEIYDKKSNITYIVGARIKNMSKKLKAQITDMDNYSKLNDDMKIAAFDLDNGKKLLVSHSLKRAKKDKYEREKNIQKLKDKFEKSQSPKDYLFNSGYKKYLQLDYTEDNNKNKECKLKLIINEEKIKEDSIWDGLKGIVTNNSELTNEELIEQYSNLWQVEESFRITKHDLKIRPIYHYKPSRVKAHLAISFMAYTLVRHLEHRVRLRYVKLSPERIRQLLLNVQVSVLFDTKTKMRFALPSNIPPEAVKIYKLMEVPLRKSAYIL
jgi:transposase